MMSSFFSRPISHLQTSLMLRTCPSCTHSSLPSSSCSSTSMSFSHDSSFSPSSPSSPPPPPPPLPLLLLLFVFALFLAFFRLIFSSSSLSSSSSLILLLHFTPSCLYTVLPLLTTIYILHSLLHFYSVSSYSDAGIIEFFVLL